VNSFQTTEKKEKPVQSFVEYTEIIESDPPVCHNPELLRKQLDLLEMQIETAEMGKHSGFVHTPADVIKSSGEIDAVGIRIH
jgi:hypothetical protein